MEVETAPKPPDTMELLDMSMPPPNLMNSNTPTFNQPPPFHSGPRFNNSFQGRHFNRPFQPFQMRGPIGPMTLEDFDGKRLRKSVMRKTVDYNSSIIHALENRTWQRDYRDRRALQPDVMYYPEMLPPPSYADNPINCVTTRFVKTATNKMRCPIFCMAWTPEGRRLVTGASSGEFTLWNGLTFNFETILQAHDSPVRSMVWSHNENWMITGDHAGYVKYWQSNMNNVKMFQAHKEAIRGLSFSPSDSKFVTCSDDGTLRIWDFYNCFEEHVLRGHGADVKCVEWHPQKALIVSGSKDNQQPIKLWDPKSGQSLATLHAHKSTVMDLQWNQNGNWLITASRDHLLKLFDIRNLSQEVQTFRGHKKEASSVAWHPVHEGLFASGGSDGSILFWHVGADKEVGGIDQAHDSIVWTLAWHPLGHILCSGSNDHSSKFWTRNRPGDLMRDKYNLNTMPAGLAGEEVDDEYIMIPGMGPEDKVEITFTSNTEEMTIPGLDLDTVLNLGDDKSAKPKKVPYSKPIPRNFQAHWNETDDDVPLRKDSIPGNTSAQSIKDVLAQLVEQTTGAVPLDRIAPTTMIVYGKPVNVEPGSELERKIAEGPNALNRYIRSGAIDELDDVLPIGDEDDDELFANLNENITFTVAPKPMFLPSLLGMNILPPAFSGASPNLSYDDSHNTFNDGSRNSYDDEDERISPINRKRGNATWDDDDRYNDFNDYDDRHDNLDTDERQRNTSNKKGRMNEGVEWRLQNRRNQWDGDNSQNSHDSPNSYRSTTKNGALPLFPNGPPPSLFPFGAPAFNAATNSPSNDNNRNFYGKKSSRNDSNASDANWDEDSSQANNGRRFGRQNMRQNNNRQNFRSRGSRRGKW